MADFGQWYDPSLEALAPAGSAVPPSQTRQDWSGSTPATWQQPSAGDITPTQRAFLTAMRGGESGGRYNVMYGGSTFEDFTDHPNKPQLITTGPNAGQYSTAAGADQFLYRTWKEAQQTLGLKDFSPESQDRAAAWLAQRDYGARTGGRDLWSDIEAAKGDPVALNRIGANLSQTWTSLPGGIERNAEGSKFGNRLSAYLNGEAAPIVPQTRADIQTSSAKRTLMVPVDHDPFNIGVSGGETPNQSSGMRAVDRLLGLGGEERFQLWPEKMLRSGATIARDVLTGAVASQPGLRREDYTDAPPPGVGDEGSTWLGRKLGLRPLTEQPGDELIARAMDLANLAATGGMASSMPKATDLTGFRVFGKTPPELQRWASDTIAGRVSPEEFLKRAEAYAPSGAERFRMDVLKDVAGYSPEQVMRMTPEQRAQAYAEFMGNSAWGAELKKTSPGSTPAGQGATDAAAAGQKLLTGPDEAGRGAVDAGAGGGGGSAGAGSLEAAQAAAARSSAGAYIPEGLPTKPLKLADENGNPQWFVPAPLAQAQKLAADYAQRAGINYQPPQRYVPVDPDRAGRIAAAFEQMPHAPDDPQVKASYQAMIDETVAQMDEVLRAGLKIEFIKPDQPDPYAVSPRLAQKDVVENNHLWVFPTDTGFGSTSEGSAAALANNPLLAPTKFTIDGRQLLANDVFRIVHDYFGHFKDGNGFRADGEEHAWRSHAAMYSPLARRAMTTETRGQNSWLNYGPYGAKNRTALTSDTVFADQKTGLLPDWVMEEGRLDPVSGKPLDGQPNVGADGGDAVQNSYTNPGQALFSNRRAVIVAAGERGRRKLTAIDKPADGLQTVTAADRLDPAYQAVEPERVQRLAQEVPGLKAVLKYMTPDERVKLRRDTATKLVDLFSNLPSAEEMAAVAHAGRAKRGWYRQSSQAIVDTFGATDAPRFAALLAALSPQTSVEMNLHNAMKTWGNWIAAGRPTEPDAILKILGRSVLGTGEASVLDAWKNNSIRALREPDPMDIRLSGPKVSSFAENLRDNVNAVTVDAWMANYANVNQDLFKGTGGAKGTKGGDDLGQVVGKSPGYIAMSAAVRKAAEVATRKTGQRWTPEEVQETVWSWAKALYEKAEERGMTTVEMLKAGGLTHEQIAETPDFGSLFVSNVYRKLLEEAGYGKEVEAQLARRGELDAARDGSRGDARSAEGSGFAQSAFERHLQRAAERLEALRNDRAANRAKPVDEAAIQEQLDERFNERAAKLEDNGMSRAEAEAQARREVYGDEQYLDGVRVEPVEGNPFAGTDVFSNKRPLIISSPEFKRWFKGSAVVEPKVSSRDTSPPAPMVVYHGSPEPLKGDTFTESRKGTVSHTFGQYETDRHGIFFSEDPDFAASFATQGQRRGMQGGNITPVYLSIKNPLWLDEGMVPAADVSKLVAAGLDRRWVENHLGDPRSTWEAFDGEDGAFFAQALKRAGYDGVRMNERDPDSGKDFNVWVAFKPEQVKSATGNSGAFDPKNPSILFSNKRPLVIPPGERAPTFYSGLEAAVMGAKITSAPPQQWANTIKNIPGVKQEEMDWIGLPDWLAEQKGNVTKQQIEDYVRANKLQLEEVVQDGKLKIDRSSPYAGVPEFMRVVEGVRNRHDARVHLANDYEAHQAAMRIPELKKSNDNGIDWYETVANSLVKGGEAAKFSSYQMEGPKDNYRNVLLKLPVKPKGEAAPYVKKSTMSDDQLQAAYERLYMLEDDHGLGGMSGEMAYDILKENGVVEAGLELPLTLDSQSWWGGMTTAGRQQALERAKDIQRRQNPEVYAEWERLRRQTQAEEQARNDDFTALNQKKQPDKDVFLYPPHWDQEPNVIAHARVNDRSLPRTEAPEVTARRSELEGEIGRVRGEQATIMADIRKAAQPYRKAHDDEVMADLRSGKISGLEAQRRLESYDVPDVIVPMQERLQELRRQEDALRAEQQSLPAAEAKTLFIEEVQSDWHQQGREKGYRGEDPFVPFQKQADDVLTGNLSLAPQDLSWLLLHPASGGNPARISALSRAYGNDWIGRAGQALSKRNTDGVPDAPLKSTPAWAGVVLKRLIREAAENGYDQIAWTPGDVQNQRWTQEMQQVSQVSYNPETKKLLAYRRGEDSEPAVEETVNPDQLPSYIGKDAAKNLMDAKPNSAGFHVLKGQDIKVGGAAFREFYDKILVNVANSIGKKYGAKVGTADVPVEGKSGFRLYRGEEILPGELLDRDQAMAARQRDPSVDVRHAKAGGEQKVWVLPITEQLRDAAVGKGFALFMKGVPVVRVDHDPFEQEQR